MNIPKPKSGRKPLYDFIKLEVHQFCTYEVPEQKILTIRQCAYNHGREHGKKFKTRYEDGFLKVYRVA